MGDFLLIKTNPKRAYSTFCYLTLHLIHFLHFMICHPSIDCKNNKQQKVECFASYIAKSGIFSTESPLKSNYCHGGIAGNGQRPFLAGQKEWSEGLNHSFVHFIEEIANRLHISSRRTWKASFTIRGKIMSNTSETTKIERNFGFAPWIKRTGSARALVDDGCSLFLVMLHRCPPD